MPSTKSQLRDAIKRESRIITNSNLDTLVDDIVADILRDACNLARYHELLVERSPLVLVAAQAAYNLPTDFMNLETVRYGIGPNPTGFKELDLQTDTVKQTWSGSGSPLFYRLVRGGTNGAISLFPFGNIAVTDVLSIDYYIDPASIYTDDDALFPIARLESAVKKMAIARVQRFHSSDNEATMTQGDGQASINASNAAS